MTECSVLDMTDKYVMLSVLSRSSSLLEIILLTVNDILPPLPFLLYIVGGFKIGKNMIFAKQIRHFQFQR